MYRIKLKHYDKTRYIERFSESDGFELTRFENFACMFGSFDRAEQIVYTFRSVLESAGWTEIAIERFPEGED